MKESLVIRVAFSLFVVSAGRNLYAQGGGWTGGGPAGRHVRSIAVDPVNSAIIYAATDQGIFRSFDRGLAWTPANDGLSNPNVFAIAVDARMPERVFAGTENPGVLYKSVDGGANWSRSDVGLSSGWVTSVVIDHADSSRIYAGTPSGLFVTEDGGERWRIALTVHNARPALNPTTPAAILVAAYGGRVPDGGFFHSADHGATWAEFTALRYIPRPLSIAVDPQNSATLLAAGQAASEFDQLAISVDGGTHWVIRTGPSLPRQILFDSVSPGVVYGISQTGAVVRSRDSGQSWIPLYPTLSNQVVTTLAIDPTGTTLYAGTLGGGVYRLDIAVRPHLARPSGRRPRVRVVAPRR